MTQRNPISEPFHLTSADGGNTAADGSVNAWSNIWKYKVPRGTTIILSPGNTFACFLEDTGPAEIGDRDARVQILVRDPAESQEIQAFGPALYVASKEQQDMDLMATLRLPEPLHVPARYWIIIQAYDGVVIDASDSFYDIGCHRIREQVGAGV